MSNLPIRIEGDSALEGANAFAIGRGLGDCPYVKGTDKYGAWMRGFLVAYGEKQIKGTPEERGAKAYFDGAKMTEVPITLSANDAAKWRDGWCKALAQSYRKTGAIIRKPVIAPMSLWFRVLAYEVELTDVVRIGRSKPFQVRILRREKGHVKLNDALPMKANATVEVRQLPVMGCGV